MSNFTILRLQDDEGSPSSDERMDTSDSYRSQDTNSISELDDHEPLRLQNPDLNVLKMSKLQIDSPKISISPPKFSSTLTLTTNHPLMGLSSPDDFPDLISKKTAREDEKDLSISSIDSERHDTNGFYSPQRNTSKNNLYFTDNFVTAESFMLNGSQHCPPDVARVEVERRRIVPRLDVKHTPTQRVLEQAVTVNMHSTPKVADAIDITREEFHSGVAEWLRKMPNFELPIEMSSSIRMNNELDSPDVVSSSTQEEKSAYQALLDPRTGSVALRQTRSQPDTRRKIRLDVKHTPTQRVLEQAVTVNMHSTPKVADAIDITGEEFHSGVAEWLRTMPNFELPIEMSSSIRMNNELDSPDVVSSSTQEEKSAYQALLDPRTGSVALRQTRSQPDTRRKIQLPPQEDTCSLDSISASSMEYEEEPPSQEPVPQPEEELRQISDDDDDDDTKRSKSTNTISYTSEPIPEYSAAEELTNERSWVSVPRAGVNRTCDMKVIEPYKRVISHGGYSRTGAALIVFSACHLPDNSRHDYTYVMDNLFLYVIWTLERLVTEEYILVYLHGSASRRLPTFHWLHECYKLIDRRLRKSLKHLYLVHPTFWLKSFVLLTKPFISSKFFSKLHYVKNLNELMSLVPVEPNAIPDAVKQYDIARRR